MFCYRIAGTINNEEIAAKLTDRENGYEERRRLSSVSEDLFERSECNSFYFIANVLNKNIVLGLICTDNRKLDAGIRSFIRKLGIDVSITDCSEITLNFASKLIRDADRMGFVNCADETLLSFGVYSLYERGYRPNKVLFEERILKDVDVQSIFNSSRCIMAKEPLEEEIKRINSSRKKARVKGHPVHYLIRTSDDEDAKAITKVLVGNLLSNNRILSKRYTAIEVYPESSCDEEQLESIYVSSKSGTVVIHLDYDNENDSEFASRGIANIEKLCAMMKKYQNDVLTIFWLPKTSERVKKNLYSELGHANLVEICDSTADSDRAKKYLNLLAEEKNVRPDKKLFLKIEDGKHYLASELNDIYDQWYSFKLKTSIYPQYKDIDSVKNKVAEEEPNGCAYDELMDMIGLERAKGVIKQALDFNKAQKIFADKGMKFDRTSMHMVFTGNPGTAKTSVARLFAQIMKDNDVLTEGKLVECGRADLVGKYVGWTAPTVKRKFAEAKGSVLFIDEAYSLVDDRDGLYGDEAINTIVQEMENHRDDVIVIFAGYPDKMEKFIQKNPGLRSRIAYHVPFDDYNVDELCSIADLISKKKGLILADDAREKLRDVFSIALKDDDFGNGRYVRNVIEKAKMVQASRLVAMDYSSITSEDVKTIVASDIEMPVTKIKTVKFGFCA